MGLGQIREGRDHEDTTSLGIPPRGRGMSALLPTIQDTHTNSNGPQLTQLISALRIATKYGTEIDKL